MHPFSLSHYALALLALFSQYGFGRRLGIRPLFSATLVGVALSALVLGSLANFCAGLIRPVLFFLLALGLALSSRDALKSLPWDGPTVRRYALLFGLALGWILLNRPQTTFLHADELRFDRHYSYYASQSVEMLRADYFHRLRVADFFPRPWVKYHFFHPATQAIAQGLLPNPGLFTYFLAQTLLTALILVGLTEGLLGCFPLSALNVVLVASWWILGFTVFGLSLRYNFITSGAFSIFAVGQLVFSLYRRNYRDGILFAGLLAASSLRLLPFGVLVVALVVIRDRPRRAVRNFWTLGALGAFFSYLGLTLGLGKSGPLPFWDRNVFSSDWFHGLSGYRMLGYLTAALGKGAWFPKWNFYMSHGQPSVFFSHVPTGFLLSTHPPPPGWFLLNLLFLTLIGVSFFLLRRLKASPILLLSVVAIQMGTLLLQYSGANTLKAPLAFTAIDTVLWVLIGLWLLKPGRFPVKALALVAIALFALVMPFQARGMLEIPYVCHPVQIRPLLQSDFARSRYVDDKNEIRTGMKDSWQQDALTAILGAHLPSDSGNREFLNSAWASW